MAGMVSGKAQRRRTVRAGDRTVTGLMRVAAAAVAVFVMAACADADATGPIDVGASSAEVVARYLSIDLAAPPNYAAPDYRAHYTRQVLAQDNSPAANPVTDEGATLGRVLFHDTELSLNRTVSCSSCHVQSQGFGDERVFSAGFEGGQTGSHSMRLANAKFFDGDDMFWDRRADDLEDQSLQPVFDRVEMGFSGEAGGIEALIARLSALEYYPVLFEWAFGSDEITETRIRAALAQYVRSIVSAGSRFDDGLAQAPPGPGQGNLPGLTDQENEGFRLFTRPPNAGGAGCAGCHEVPTMALDGNSRSNGLDAGETRIFKSPSLKNVAVGGPYMHDGRFATLTQVVEHYSTGIQDGPALDRRLRGGNGQPIRPRLSVAETAALVAFMETLTDTGLLEDTRFSSPFTR